MKVKEIRWIDKDLDEASVIVYDGIHECLAFSHPCHFNVGDELEEPLYSLGESLVYLVEQQEFKLRQQSGIDNWNHELVGKVLDKNKNLIQIGQLKIVLNSLPGDIANGDFVECCTSRLDIIP